MHMALSRAHDEVARLGLGQSIDARPRATIAMCVVQEGAAYWAHVGDSRIYWIRHGKMLTRTRDHSHVELLLREGKITEEELPPIPCAISWSAASAAIRPFRKCPSAAGTCCSRAI